MARKKRPFEFTREDWKALAAWISMVCDLDKKKFRDDVEKLATAIEHEGHAAHRSADVLEGLSMFKNAGRDVKPSHHARSAILSRLKRWHDDDKRQLRVAEGRLDQLVEVGVRDQLRQQAAVLLDAAELIRMNLRWHEQRLEKLRPSEIGHAILRLEGRCNWKDTA